MQPGLSAVYIAIGVIIYGIRDNLVGEVSHKTCDIGIQTGGVIVIHPSLITDALFRLQVGVTK